MFNVSTALSAMRANQSALMVIGNNVANANTPDYHRQELRLVDARPVEMGGIHIGQGVEISYVHRAYDSVTESALTRNVSEQAAVNVKLQTSREIESMFTPGQGTILDRLETFFNNLQVLTGEPNSAANRSVVVQSAKSVTDAVNGVANKLETMVERLDRAIEDKLSYIYDTSKDIVELNLKIREAQIRRQSPNDLLDRRDQMVNELAKVIDVRIDTEATETADGSIPETVLRMADGGVQLLRFPLDFRATTDPATGNRVLYMNGAIRPTEVTQGELGGLLEARNSLVPDYQSRLATFTDGLVRAFDKVHVNGVGVAGSFDILRGQRAIEEPDVPLAEAETVLPIAKGSFFISVIAPDGSRTVNEIEVDPAVDSFADIATRIGTFEHLESRVDTPPGQLSIRAETGYRFDFVTVEPTLLNTTQITGTTVPVVSGEYKGAANDEYVFEFQGSGTIGQTPGLLLNVRDSKGAIVGEFIVGQGFDSSQPLKIGNGVNLKLSAGTANVGDTFSLKLIHDADSTNLLTAAGLNTLFTGGSPLSLSVREDLLAHPEQFAVTRSGHPLDSSNAEAMINMRFQQIMDGGTETLEENMADTISSVGGSVADLDGVRESLDVVGQALRAERDSHSGVDPNEEAVKMLQFQRGFQSAARYITVLDETLAELMGIIR